MAEQQAQQPTESPVKTDAPVLETKPEEVPQEQVAVQPAEAQAHQDAATVAAVQAVEQQMPADASYAQLQQDQWAQQQYYQVTGDHSLGADYSQMNVNGVMPLPGTEHGGDHYVADSDYTAQVAATLSNWHEANPVDQSNAGVGMVGADGTAVGLGEQVGNGEVPVQTAPMTDKPKKLVLACHFCRGRKLKCDGARPTCGHCAKRSLTCTYDEQVRRRGPGKRTKEMRERAAREAEAAGLGLSAEQIAEQLNAVGSTLGEPPKKAGRKRKSETLDEAEKKARLMDDTAAAVAAAQAMQQEHTDHVTHSLEHTLSAHDMQHGLPHDMSAIDPSLAGADGVGVMDLPPLEAGTLGQVIQQLNGEQHQQQ